MNRKARVIAFYLPQYHPFKENDEWWGKGFTEWTNVAKAKPLFRGHYQPKIPADLGFYDLRVPEVREEQARMAREAGIEGFCYWHYWFHGHELMERPFWEVVESGKPDFPFCIGWANETWKSKMWNKDGSLAEGTKVLIEQTYSEEDDIAHFNKLLPVFKDHRYITVDGKPLVFIHIGLDLPELTIKIWNKLAVENGLKGIHFVGRLAGGEFDSVEDGIEKLRKKGFDAIKIPMLPFLYRDKNIFSRLKHEIVSFFKYNGCRHVFKYEDILDNMIDAEHYQKGYIYPTIYPGWDHSARGGGNTLIVINNEPYLFKKIVEQDVKLIKNKSEQHRIVFLKSWNEWGEGNYVEPDMNNGDGFLVAIKDAIVE
jgi:lipopolysaccharide biosynthesis protein